MMKIIGDYRAVIRNEHGEVEFAFKFYVTVEGGMDFRAMLMKRKVKQKKIVVKTIEWLEVGQFLEHLSPILVPAFFDDVILYIFNSHLSNSIMLTIADVHTI